MHLNSIQCNNVLLEDTKKLSEVTKLDNVYLYVTVCRFV